MDENSPFDVIYITSFIYRSLTVKRTRSGRVFGRVLHVENTHRTSFVFLLFVKLRYIPICNTMQYMYQTKYAFPHHAANLYQYVEEVNVFIKATLQIKLLSNLASS